MNDLFERAAALKSYRALLAGLKSIAGLIDDTSLTEPERELHALLSKQAVAKAVDPAKKLKEFGERLRQRRKELGWRKSELAYRSRVSASAIREYERGENYPRGAILTALTATLGVSEDWLLEGEE